MGRESEAVGKYWIWIGLIVVAGAGAAVLAITSTQKYQSNYMHHTPEVQRVERTATAIHLYMEDNNRVFPVAANWKVAVQPYANFPVGESAQVKNGQVEFNPRLSAVRWSGVYSKDSYLMLRDLNPRPGTDLRVYASTRGWIRSVMQRHRFEAFEKAWNAHPNDEVGSQSVPLVIPYDEAATALKP